MRNLLILSAIGKDHTGIVEQMSFLAANCQCSIVDHRMSVLGGQCATIMMVKGEWNALTKMEHEVPVLATKMNLTTIAQVTSVPDTVPEQLPYTVKVTTLDKPGIAHKVSGFFSAREINIEELHSHSYAAPITGSQLVRIVMQISLAPEVKISTLKSDFQAFCSDYNLDASLDPINY